MALTSTSRVGKCFSWMVTLTIQELAGSQGFKSWQVKECKWLIFGFENDGLQKKVKPSIWTDNALIQTKNGIAALSMMASIIFSSQHGKCGQPFCIK